MITIPGIPYGTRKQLIPNCRSFDLCLKLYVDPTIQVKLVTDITDKDSCARGPDGKPLARVTPFVPALTLAQWKEQNEN